MNQSQRGSVIAAICSALEGGSVTDAEAIVRRDYPFDPAPVAKRRFRPVEYAKVFVRDGFIDRYSGSQLIFPPVLRVLSLALPTSFPYHPNWKMDETHLAFWEVSATLDHVVPVSRGGADVERNWVTTSMARNAAKANWTLEELGWGLRPPGTISEWDGMIRWFLEYTAQHPEIPLDNAVRQWRKGAEVALAGWEGQKPMGDTEKARRLFRENGLVFPTIPDEAVSQFKELREWLFSTREIEIPPYDLQHYLHEFDESNVEDYVILAHSGHGLNSYAIQYYVVRGALRLFLHLGWGGAYSDAQADAAQIADCFSLADQIVALAHTAEKLQPNDQLIVVCSDFYGSHWSPPGESGKAEVERSKRPAEVLAEVLRWLLQ